MAGVIDSKGQWERCNVCTQFRLIRDLGYERPSLAFPYGRDICKVCAYHKAKCTVEWTVFIPELRDAEIMSFLMTKNQDLKPAQRIGALTA